MDRTTGLWVTLLLCAVSSAAHAQRTDDNAVRSAEDGFGSSVGNEEIGIYNIGSARGFSPLDAGNVRMEGLYLDVHGDIPDGMLSGSAVKVGITAIRTPLLAPSGVAEFSLKQIGDRSVSSIGLILGDFGSPALEAETRIGRKDGFSLVAAGRLDIDSNYAEGSDDHGWNYALVPRLQLGSDSHVQAYFGQSRFTGFEDGPFYYTSGAYTPPRIPRRRRVQQDWNQNGGLSTQSGLVVNIGLGDGWRAKAGVFRAQIGLDSGVFEFVDQISADGRGVRSAVLSPRYDARSWSGEARLTKSLTDGDIQAELSASVRFRSVRETSGAGELFVLDPAAVPLSTGSQVPYLQMNFNQRDTNEVRQIQPGLSGMVSMKGLGAVNLGLQTANYRKRVRFGSGLETDVTSKPLLWNAGVALLPFPKLTIYAGMSRGLEEAGVAPDIAVNSNTALPAAITVQRDVGLHWKPNDHFSLIAGAFSIRRPYANLDEVSIYRYLGELSNKGLEMSLVARPGKGVNLVVGATRQWPRLAGEDVDNGVTGKVPVAFAEYQANVAIDADLPWLAGLSANANMWVTGPREARADGALRLPVRQRTDIGLRYRFKRHGADWSLSANVGNVFDSYGWNVSGDGGFSYSSPRSFSLTLFGDF